VLTAAHVAQGMYSRSDGNIKVFVDDHEEGYSVDQVVVHPDFSPMGPNDIALLHLNTPVPDVSPVDLFRSRDEEGQMLILVGHGDTKKGTGGDWVRDPRRRGATNVVDEVNDAHIIFDFDAPGEATDLEGTAGPGDSGGPAFITVDGTARVAGVSSLGEPGENGPGTYGAREHYVRVSSYATWIDSILSDPPSERAVNVASIRRRDGGPGARQTGGAKMLDTPTILEEIGLLVADRNGRVQMVGRIDHRYPETLLAAGIRPPAVVLRINGVTVDSAADLKTHFDAIKSGDTFSIVFEHQKETAKFEIIK